MTSAGRGSARPADVYLVAASKDGRSRRAEGALAGLESYLTLTRSGEGDWPDVLDASRRRVTPAQLLGRARREAAEDPAAQRRMVSAIADYLAAERGAAWDAACQAWRSLHDDEARLLLDPNQDAMREALERIQKERERLAPTLFGTSAWREAGLAWTLRFGSIAPQAVVDYLAAGHGVRFDASELVEGVRDLLRVIDQRRPEREASAACPIESSALEDAPPLPGDRQRGLGR